MAELLEAIRAADFFTLKPAYDGPFKTERSWWGFQVIVDIDQQSKSVRFHSEDDSVPAALKALVERIMRATAGPG